MLAQVGSEAQVEASDEEASIGGLLAAEHKGGFHRAAAGASRRAAAIGTLCSEQAAYYKQHGSGIVARGAPRTLRNSHSYRLRPDALLLLQARVKTAASLRYCCLKSSAAFSALPGAPSTRSDSRRAQQ